METLLRALVLAVFAVSVTPAGAQDQRSDKHRLSLSIDLHAVSADTELESWPSGGLGKLRFDDSDGLTGSNRIALDYSGRLRPTLWGRVVADYVDDASPGLDITEAYLTWRPVPKRPIHHQLRFGAFYPPLSLENSGPAWSSPYTISFSAINTWLGEEIRPIGLEWTLRRRIGGPTSASQFATFASLFYGNDPAATMLFWRGWSLHDRQTRLNDKFDIPPLPSFDQNGNVTGLIPQTLEPIVEIDSRPGFYAGAEWTMNQRLKLQIAHYDNRAEPEAFRDGQWGWNTRFSTLGFQASLPAEFGLIIQAMTGKTGWLAGARQDGTIAGPGPLVTDHFDSAFVLLTRRLGHQHRLTARWDEFEITRPGMNGPLDSDAGTGYTLAYRYDGMERFALSFEWLRIQSERALWSYLYASPYSADEQQLRAQVSLRLDL